MDLTDYGWSLFFDEHMAPYRAEGLEPARVLRAERDRWSVQTAHGPRVAHVSGRFRFAAVARSELPVTGDWVAVDASVDPEVAIIHALLPRCSRLSRKEAGARTEEQVLAANIDTMLVVTAMDQEFSPRRLERYLAVAWETGASAALVLNKCDLCDDAGTFLADAEALAPGVGCHPVSALTGEGIDDLRPYLVAGQTVALIGSSGVGKSSLINALVGSDALKTAAVREDDHRGRHTTTWREMVRVPDGGLIIDSPGIRELQLWTDEDSLAASFADIEALAKLCRFGDCTHRAEPGCAVQAALDDGTLSKGRYDNYRKLERELAFLETRQNQQARRAERERSKRRSRYGKRRQQLRDQGLVR